MSMTSDRILRGIKRRMTFPGNQSVMDDDDILEICDDVISIDILPHIVSLRQDYVVRKIKVPCVSGQKSYLIPYRAIGQTLRDLKIVDSSNRAYDMRLIQIEDEHKFRISGSSAPSSAFYFSGDSIVLTSDADSAWSLEFWVDFAISRLVKVQDCALVQSISMDDVTVETVPSTIQVGDEIDFVRSKQGSNVIDYDKAVNGITGTTLQFSSGDVPDEITDDILSVLEPGDYIAPAQTTPVLPVPEICARYLETKACARILGAISDFENQKIMEQKAEIELKSMLTLMAPRIRGESIKILNHGLLRRGPQGILRRGIYR
jgi:hypothetical protein